MNTCLLLVAFLFQTKIWWNPMSSPQKPELQRPPSSPTQRNHLADPPLLGTGTAGGWMGVRSCDHRGAVGRRSTGRINLRCGRWFCGSQRSNLCGAGGSWRKAIRVIRSGSRSQTTLHIPVWTSLRPTGPGRMILVTWWM